MKDIQSPLVTVCLSFAVESASQLLAMREGRVAGRRAL